jgi:signal transduction histidine kinase
MVPIHRAGDLTRGRRTYDHHVKGITRPLPPIAPDIALSVGLTIVNVVSVLPYRRQLHPLGFAVLLVVLESAPLVGRRTWPVPTFMVIGAARVIYDVVGFGWAPLPLSVGLAVFTVADRCGPRVRRGVGLMLLAGILTSQFALPHDQPYDITFTSLFFVTAWIAGVASRTRRAYTEEVELRARRAESDQDNRAARAANDERNRIARELHDVVAHHVSLIAVQAEARLRTTSPSSGRQQPGSKRSPALPNTPQMWFSWTFGCQEWTAWRRPGG